MRFVTEYEPEDAKKLVKASLEFVQEVHQYTEGDLSDIVAGVGTQKFTIDITSHNQDGSVIEANDKTDSATHSESLSRAIDHFEKYLEPLETYEDIEALETYLKSETGGYLKETQEITPVESPDSSGTSTFGTVLASIIGTILALLIIVSLIAFILIN